MDHSTRGFWNMVLGSTDWAHGEMEHHGYGNVVKNGLHCTVVRSKREKGIRDQV